MTQESTKGTEFTCSECGENFVLSYFREDEPKYCSTECAGEAQRSAEAVECEQCGGSVEVDSYVMERNDRHYCSRECWREGTKERVEVTCEVCGESEMVTATRASQYRTCSRECLNEVQSEEFSGESNPNSRDDVDTAELIERYRDGESTVVLADRYDMTPRGVSQRLKRAGVERREAGWPKHTETSFGLAVRSSHEKRVAEMLHGAGVEFEYEPADFPGPYVPDFVLDDGTVIEVWGVDSERYDERRTVKEAWYRENGHSLIGITP